jgi:hypothetical protein
MKQFKNGILSQLGPVPAFTETSSPELDALLSSFRTKVFLPAHLSKDQQDLISKRKYMRALTVEPVIARIGDEDFRLEHLDQLTDLPSTKKGLDEVMSLMKDKKDWNNIIPLLHGLHNAGRVLSDVKLNKLLRRAALAGRLDVILECARRVSDTGFTLKNPEVVAEFMWRIQDKAYLKNWDAKETKQALSWAEMVSDMLEDERHAGSKTIAGEADPRVRPEVTGIMLQLAAVRAAKHLDGKDEGGKVADYAERLLKLPVDIERIATAADEDIHAANHRLSILVPILHGMKVAQTVLDPASNIAEQLKEKTSKVQKLVAQKRQKLISKGQGKTFRGLTTYDNLLGKSE